MQIWEQWRRLFWKETRESRALLVCALVTPPVVFTAAARVDIKHDVKRDLITSAASIGIPLLVAAWSTRRVAMCGRRQLLGFSLPVSRSTDTVAQFLLPLVMTAILGAWLGLWTTELRDWAHPAQAIVAGALYLAAIYAACDLLSSALSKYAGISVGIGLTLVGATAYRWLAAPILNQDLFEAVALLAAGPISGGLLLRTLPRNIRTPWQQVLPLGLALTVAFGHVIYRSTAITDERPTSEQMHGNPFHSDDLSLDIEPGSMGPGTVIYTFADYKQPFESMHAFDDVTLVIGIVDRRTACLAQQVPKDKAIKLLTWKVNDQVVIMNQTIPSHKNALRDDFIAGSVSPYGRFALLILGSIAGDGCDLWLIDLSTKKSLILMANVWKQPFDRIDWTRTMATLSGEGRPVAVDLVNRQARYMSIPMRRE